MEELVEILQEGLLRHRKRLPALTLRSMERTSQVPRKFLAQLERGDKACGKNFPLLVDTLRYLKQYGELDEEATNESLKKMLPTYDLTSVNSFNIFDRITFLILIHASHHCGVTRENIILTLGESAGSVLNEMLKKEQIIECEGSFYLRGKKDFLLSLEGVKFHQKTLADFTTNSRTEFNHSHLVTEKLTLDAVKQLSQLYYELYQKVHTIIADAKNHGDLPFFGFGSCDLFSYKGTENDE